MSTGLKVWLWIMLILNAIVAVFSVIAIAIAPTSAISLVFEIALIAGIVLLLFKQKKLGFYIMVCCKVAGFIVYIILGTQNIIMSLISAIIVPGITYLLMRKNWDEFE